jgi:hypothetical protein
LIVEHTTFSQINFFWSPHTKVHHNKYIDSYIKECHTGIDHQNFPAKVNIWHRKHSTTKTTAESR